MHSISTVKRRKLLVLFGAASAAMHAGSSLAQAVAPPADQGDIVVTARKREQRLQETPAAISLITGDQFRTLGLSTASDVATKIPGFQFTSPVGEGGNPSLSIRGVGLNDFSDNNEGPVAVYVDEVYVGSLAGQAAGLFDLARVEVLKGPQGTLYGRNTTAGLVSFLTKKPSQEFSGYVQAGYANYNEFRVEGAVGGPLTDTISARISAAHSSGEGMTYDRVSGERGGRTDTTAGRLQLRFESGANDVLLSGHLARSRGTSQFYSHRGTTALPGGGACGVADALAGRCVDSYGYRDTDGNPYSGDYTGGAKPLDVDSEGGFLRYAYKAGSVDLVSITSYDHIKKFQVETPYSGPSVPSDGTYRLNDHQISQELRASATNGPLSWVVGGYFYKDKKQDDFAINFIGYDYPYTQRTRALAAFGQVDWKVLPRLTATLGLRYNNERKSILASANGSALGGVDFVDQYRRLQNDALSGTAGLSWQANRDMFVYATVSRGFKSGGFNGSFVATPDALDPFKPEQITAYEVGIKNTLADGHLTLNLGAFYYDYKNFQALTQANVDGLPVTLLTNAGSATVKGLEAEVRTKGGSFYEIGGGVSLLDTKTKDFFAFNGYDANLKPIYINESGGNLVSAPHVSANADIRLFRPLGSGEISLQSDADYRSHFYFDTSNTPLTLGGGALEINAQLAWERKRQGLRLSVWGKNINGAKYINAGFSVFGSQSLIYNRPRTYGVTVSQDF